MIHPIIAHEMNRHKIDDFYREVEQNRIGKVRRNRRRKFFGQVFASVGRNYHNLTELLHRRRLSWR